MFKDYTYTDIHVQCMTNQMIVTCRKFISVPTNTHDTLTTNKISNLFQLEGNSLISGIICNT